MKKNLLTVLILALLIVNIVLTTVMMVSVVSTNKKTAELVTNIATVMNLELTVPGGEVEEKVVSMADTEVYNLEGGMTIPLVSPADGEQEYIMFEAAISMDTKNKGYKKYGGEKIGERASLIEDAITGVVSRHTQEECQNDFESIKAEILQALQELFDSDFIYKVAISNIKYG